MNVSHAGIREAIRQELESARAIFHALLTSLSEEDSKKQSLNPGWTNGEILAHMVFGFIITDVTVPLTRLWGRLPRGSSKWFAWLLNALTVPFNWINALGARGQGKVFTYQRLGEIYDRTHFSLLKKIDSIKDHEWDRGMYYPMNWDPNFDEFMSLEKLFHYPVKHFHIHLNQLSR
jgi:hypothetical protein